MRIGEIFSQTEELVGFWCCELTRYFCALGLVDFCRFSNLEVDSYLLPYNKYSERAEAQDGDEETGGL